MAREAIECYLESPLKDGLLFPPDQEIQPGLVKEKVRVGIGAA